MNKTSLDWHVSLHFFSAAIESTREIRWREKQVTVVDLSASQLHQPFPASFDEFVASLNSLDGGYAEGDGSYGLLGDAGTWKICGNIYERQDEIQYVELIGRCPRATLVQFVSRLHARPDQCIFQQMQGGFFQSFDQFCNLHDLQINAE